MTLYQILGVPHGASADLINERFRALAFLAHPDRGGDPERFRLLTEAWETLRDPARRAAYDRELRVRRLEAIGERVGRIAASGRTREALDHLSHAIEEVAGALELLDEMGDTIDDTIRWAQAQGILRRRGARVKH